MMQELLIIASWEKDSMLRARFYLACEFAQKLVLAYFHKIIGRWISLNLAQFPGTSKKFVQKALAGQYTDVFTFDCSPQMLGTKYIISKQSLLFHDLCSR